MFSNPMPEYSALRAEDVPPSVVRSSAPEGQTPYVWCFPKGGGASRKKSPKKLFTDTDMYTVRGVDGSRDLTLEHGLSELESDFATIR